MKATLPLLIIALPGCAYTAMDVYRHDNEIVLRNESANPATSYVSYSGDVTVTGIGPGEEKMIFYDKATHEHRFARVRVVTPNRPDAEIEVPMVLGTPSVLKLWDKHHLNLSSSGGLTIKN